MIKLSSQTVEKKKTVNRIIAENIVNGRTKERLIETIEYYLDALNELEGK